MRADDANFVHVGVMDGAGTSFGFRGLQHRESKPGHVPYAPRRPCGSPRRRTKRLDRVDDPGNPVRRSNVKGSSAASAGLTRSNPPRTARLTRPKEVIAPSQPD